VDSPYSKKRPSPQRHKVPTRSNITAASPRTFQRALVDIRKELSPVHFVAGDEWEVYGRASCNKQNKVKRSGKTILQKKPTYVSQWQHTA